jgi:hypothetical protein
MLWLDAGDAEAAGQVLERLAGSGFGYLSRDVDWLLTVATLTDVAARLGRAEVAREGIALLEPYAGRAVVNAGGVGFVGVVDDYLAAAARTVGRDDAALRWAKTATACYQRIGATWWLNRLTASPDALPSAVRSTMAFRRAGDGLWQIGPLHDAVMLREMKGFGYVQQLLQHPGVEIGALQLSDWAAGHPGAGVTEGAADDVIDRRALQAYRGRLAAIDIELDAADRAGDAGRSERLRAERDAVLGEVQSATGLGGRPRQSGSSQERARVAVRKAVAAAIERVAAHDPALGRLLADCIDTGRTCRYRADRARPVEWLLT